MRHVIGARAAAILGLAALVAATSSARSFGRGGSGFPLWLTIGLLAALLATIVLFAALSTLTLTHALFSETRSRTKTVAGLVVGLVITAFALAAVFGSRTVGRMGYGHCSPLHPCHPAGGSASHLGSQPRTFGPPAQSLLVVSGSIAGVIVLLGCAALLYRLRRGRMSTPLPGEELAFVVEDALADLHAESDVRRAIIDCYARMERSSKQSGLGRDPSEAPLEYLRRVLMAIAPVPGRRLTRLFERAAFSVEPMGRSDKEQAIRALEALRAELRAVSQ